MKVNPLIIMVGISPTLSMIYVGDMRRKLNEKIDARMEQHKKDMDIKLKEIMKPYKI